MSHKTNEVMSMMKKSQQFNNNIYIYIKHNHFFKEET
jgi:hypothetical protein